MRQVWLVLFGITLLGSLLRFFNLSPFTVYPDSFQNLIVAQNLRTYGSVAGYLGVNGMFYPDFFMWTRPLFPLLINAISFFGVSPLIAGRSIAFVLGILGIPLSYLFIKTVFKNTNLGITAALLLAFSYNHTVWSGLLMTEAVGVFFMLFFLWQFFSTVAKTTDFFKLQNIYTGLLFAIAVLSRYEYAIIALPVILYVFTKSPNPYKYVITVFTSFFVILAIAGYLFYPLNSLLPVILQQNSDLLIKIAIVIGILVLCYLVLRLIPKHHSSLVKSKFPAFTSILLALYFCFFIILFMFGSWFGFVYQEFSFVRSFIQHDILLSLFGFIGLLKLLENKKNHALAYFVLLSTLLLGIIYQHINPDMERYMTHLIPFFLIPAAFGIREFYQTAFINQTKNMRLFLNGIIVLLILSQIYVTVRGLRNLNDSSWFRPSYEEKAAILTGQHITGNPILITSFPEPYYYFLQKDTQSIADTSPFIYIPSSQDNRTVFIVEDMGMRDIFPNFTKQIETKLHKYKYSTFSVHEWYHYTNRSIPENKPVELYKIKLLELKKILY